MSNMSYCRFENTLRALRDCEEHLEDNDLSKPEKEFRGRLLKLCKLITEDNMDT